MAIDKELETLLKAHTGQLKMTRGDDTILDLTMKNGKPARFTAIRKEALDTFKTKIDGHGMGKPSFTKGIDRLAETLKAGGAEVVKTVHSDWLRQPGPDGKISIEIERSTRRRLDKLRRPGESDEDVINRVLSPKREPNYPPGTPEHDLAKELAPILMMGSLEETRAKTINRKLLDMPESERAEFLKNQIIESLGPNDGTDKWAERLGMLMAFVEHTLSEQDAKRIREEVVDKFRPVDHEMDRVAQQAALKIAKTLDTLPPDMAANVVQSLIDGSLMVEDGHADEKVMPGFTDHVTRHLAKDEKGRATIQRLLDSDNEHVRFTPEQRANLQFYIATGNPSPALKVIKEKRRELHQKREELAAADAAYHAAQRRADVTAEILAMTKDLRLSRLGETGFHKAVEAWKNATIILPTTKDYTGLSPELLDAISAESAVFVVQHDWAGAFEKATDFAEGDVRMPFDDVVFEFRIGGRRVCCCIRSKENDASACILLIETKVGWALGAMYSIQGGAWTFFHDAEDLCAPILNLCRSQIRAMCIALEAELAVTEVIRAPHRLNRARERAGKIPVFDHHIVHLANRKRYLPREVHPGEIEEEHHGKRLHFVRGHWRHYTNGKSWIKWHLRGNPDLGFVDKEYRL